MKKQLFLILLGILSITFLSFNEAPTRLAALHESLWCSRL